jgi:hypothetical protein
METKGTIYKTTNYGQFKRIIGNRPEDERHIRRLMISYQEEYLEPIITVNEKKEIIDGQHRLEAAQRLGLPIWYREMPGWGLREIQRSNSINSTWNTRNFLHSYCELGIKPYQQFKQFIGEYPDFGIKSAECIVTGFTSKAPNSKTMIVNGKKSIKNNPFRSGELQISNLEEAYGRAAEIMKYKPLYDGYNKLTFVRTMVGLLKNRHFNNDVMIHKLSLQPRALIHCRTVDQYKVLMEEIYNYKNRVKVSFRF